MTLNEKFEKATDGWIVADRCEEVSDEFAIGFAEWMASGVEFIDDTERGRIYYFKHHIYNTKELLEIYKKENGL